MGCMEAKYPREIKNQVSKVKEKEVLSKTNLAPPSKGIKATSSPDSEAHSLVSEKDTREELQKIDQNAKITKPKIPMIKTAVNSPKDVSYVRRAGEITDDAKIKEKTENTKEEKSSLKPENFVKKESEAIIINTELKTDNNAVAKSNCENLKPSEKLIFPNISPNFDFSFIDEKDENEKIQFDVVKEKETMVDQLIQEFIEI
ncbi:unnamed protein product [Blepharisma stoltei]|uniref:Uncharacterized protein n=1 Tax=Blepharisma stoltei TaxID=1481888 RepID=A0AAU9JMT9_9CILI|nr:unnamed protein product [Blepharisma stoltei]